MPSSATLLPSLATLPFLLHILTELPASVAFCLDPDAQLAAPQPLARPLLRQYAALLLASNLVALVFVLRDVDATRPWGDSLGEGRGK
ncbi:MAG: hypothetical protein M1832_004818 [Thelocarpon impressellum]|nr:MAG: hypothetical protein M1832_004818 [Thelocarpon impressellum]